MTPLILPLKASYFNEIREGTKPEEFRLVTPYWIRRLVGKEFSHIEFTLGYPARSNAERRLIRPWRGMRIATITHPHFGTDPVEVFAIRAN
ncbi:RNA-binding protein [Roseateles terrae]|nr:RNA-binding protein [Roseateles terrae]